MASTVSPVPPLGSASALPAARLARMLVGKAATELEEKGIEVVKLWEAINNLEEPLSAERAAQAYDKAREVRQSCGHDCPPGPAKELEELGKAAALVVREVLVLEICCRAGSLSDVAFEAALEQAFQRQLLPELRSQLHGARSAICRMGRDRFLFERQAREKVYGPEVTAAELNELFPAYADCAVSVGNDRGASVRPHQPPTSKRRKKPRDREGNRAEAAATDDEEYARAGLLANTVAESVLEPAYVPLPRWQTSAMGAMGAQTSAMVPAMVPRPLQQREWTGGDFVPANQRFQ
jgi:hypothetical protein